MLYENGVALVMWLAYVVKKCTFWAGQVKITLLAPQIYKGYFVSSNWLSEIVFECCLSAGQSRWGFYRHWGCCDERCRCKHTKLKSCIWAASSEIGTYRLCEQRRFRRACASAQSHQNLRYSLIQAVSQEEPSDRKPDPWPLWMAGHAQLKFVMTECSKTQIRLTGLSYNEGHYGYYKSSSIDLSAV